MRVIAVFPKLRLGLFQDRDVWIGVFPKPEEVLKWASAPVLEKRAMIEKLLKFGHGLSAISAGVVLFDADG
jgi:hypothetical protein